MEGRRLIDFKADILSCYSIGGVLLGANVDAYKDEMHARFEVHKKEYFLPDNTKRISYFLDGTMSISTLSDGVIFSLGCNESYKGLYRGRLHAGQTMGRIRELTSKQRIFNGSIIVDDDFGVSFVLPAPYDEIADGINDVPSELVISEIYVADFLSWKSRRKNI